MTQDKTGIILLAAGSSSRMGRPKQNLIYRGQTLLQHALKQALQTHFKPVILVVGAHPEVVDSKVENLGVEIVTNPDWADGMATSIRVGLKALIKSVPPIGQVIIMVCDQPFVSTSLLTQLVKEKENIPGAIVASAYQHTFGTPVLFPQKYFPDLLQLQGSEGAKKLLFRYPESVLSVPFPEGNIDIDTVQDYEALQHYSPGS